MIIKNIIAVVATAALMLAGCSTDESGRAKTVEYIAVSTNIGSLSRTTTDDKGVQSFVANDKISVYAWLGDATAVNTGQLVVSNSVNTFDGSAWAASPQMLWKDMTSSHFFLGVYPNKAITDFTADAYALNATAPDSNDVLVALNTTGLKATNSPVVLQFDHVMAKLIVNLSYRSQWGGTPEVTSVTVNAKDNATIDYIKKAVTVTGAKADIVLAATTANTTYSSIMVPQAGEATTIKINIGGVNYTYTGAVQLESGKYTTVNLIVGRDAITLDKVAINDWGKGDVIEGGEAQEKGVSLSYTSTDGQIVTPAASAFDAEISTNTYTADAKGVITFKTPVTVVRSYAFSSRTTLSSITLPEGVTAIKDAAFSGCTSLSNITLPEGLTAINNELFSGCKALTDITIPSGVTTIGMQAFNGCAQLESVTLPEKITRIDEAAFSGCKALKTIDLPEGLQNIGGEVFYGCSALNNIKIPNGVNAILQYTFMSCTSLTNIEIPATVQTIGIQAFASCTSLASITVPRDVNFVGAAAFSGCTSLSSLSVAAGNSKYDSREKCNAVIETATKTLIASCQSTVIPASVTAIGAQAFANNRSLTSIALPEGVTKIGNYAFSDCTSLQTVYCRPVAPPELGSDVFYNAPSSLKIYVPTNSVADYRGAANWKDYATHFYDVATAPTE